ncbi:Pentatricopeptide repeat-containing protein, chloroplastic [Vitis vinifera]|uniref:Pentatricopeptide repeat-containing protein, chloroplastic n=1 Tax=Vitis vinifera TaxID=29760 RepID=A0A438GDW4_VITVI|nr:Pentatricopeptide repeat-containing protein, chloroplastic [Vitis vinifera]
MGSRKIGQSPAVASSRCQPCGPQDRICHQASTSRPRVTRPCGPQCFDRSYQEATPVGEYAEEFSFLLRSGRPAAGWRGRDFARGFSFWEVLELQGEYPFSLRVRYVYCGFLIRFNCASLFPFLPVGAKSYRGYIFSGEWVVCCCMRAVVRRAYSVREEPEFIERYGELEKQDYLREWTGLRVFKHMTEETNVRSDDFTFTSALAACAGLASMSHGKQIHAHLIRTRLYQDLGVDNALVNMYAKCGCIGYAYDIFSKMVHHNLVSWNTIIAGFGSHGLGERVVELFE